MSNSVSVFSKSIVCSQNVAMQKTIPFISSFIDYILLQKKDLDVCKIAFEYLNFQSDPDLPLVQTFLEESNQHLETEIFSQFHQKKPDHTAR
jgi:hypothetical protein